MHCIFVALEKVHKELGTGHVVRIDRLVSGLFEIDSFKNDEFTLFSNNKASVEKLDGVFVEDFDSANTVLQEYLATHDVDIAVFDCLDHLTEVRKAFWRNRTICVSIDGSNAISPFSSILINPVIENENACMTGAPYSLHHESSIKEFIPIQDRERRVFVSFGGVDSQGYLSKVLPLLSTVGADVPFDIVVSEEAEVPALVRLIGTRENIKFHYRPPDFYQMLGNSALAIISGGVVLQEASYLGVPSLVLPQYKHQYDAALLKKEEGSCIDVFPIGQINEGLATIVQRCLFEKVDLVSSSHEGRSRDDGFGVRRLQHIIRVVERLDWDSNFFEKSIFNITCKTYSDVVKERLNKLLAREEVDLVYFLCPKKDGKSISKALGDGFIEVDQRLTYLARRTVYDRLAGTVDRSSSGRSVRKATAQDIQALIKVAGRISWSTRYTNDPNFDPLKIKTFYEEWVAKSVNGGLDDEVYVVEEAADSILGFISVKRMGINLGSIGLVGVAPENQGKGVGQTLTSFAVKLMMESWNCAAVQVVTQETNISACKTYEKLGFEPSDRSVWLHKWRTTR